MSEMQELILSIYDAAIEPNKWPKVLLNAAHFVGARGATVFELEELSPSKNLKMSMCSENYSPERNKYYLEHHSEDELLDQEIFARHSKLTDNIELISDSVLASSREELLKREHVKILREFEVGYRAAALLNKDIPSLDRFAFQFSESHGPLDNLAIQRSKLILPHIAKALNVSRPIRELAFQKETLFSSLDMLIVGICIVNQQNDIMITNSEFERQLDYYEAFYKTLDGKLRFNNTLASDIADKLLDSFYKHGLHGARPRKEAIIYGNKSKTSNLCLDIVPLESSAEFDVKDNKASIIFSLDTTKYTKFDSHKISEIFKLTFAETQVLEQVSEGATNAEISEKLNKSVHTIDTQMKSILSKSMTSNRTQLIRVASQTRSFIKN